MVVDTVGPSYFPRGVVDHLRVRYSSAKNYKSTLACSNKNITRSIIYDSNILCNLPLPLASITGSNFSLSEFQGVIQR